MENMVGEEGKKKNIKKSTAKTKQQWLQPKTKTNKIPKPRQSNEEREKGGNKRGKKREKENTARI